MVKISVEAQNKIKYFEGFYPNYYLDPVGVGTIGWGHTGPEAYPGNRITKKRAQELFDQKIAEDAAHIARLVKVPLTQGQLDALHSFVFNFGPTKFAGSTLLKLLNRGNYIGAAGQFKRWVHGTDVKTKRTFVLPGLVKRREWEYQQFIKDGTGVEPDDGDHDDDDYSEISHPRNMDSRLGGYPAPLMSRWEALKRLFVGSDTFKAIYGILGSLGVLVSNVMDTLLKNPIALLAIIICLIFVVAVVYVKVRDTREGS